MSGTGRPVITRVANAAERSTLIALYLKWGYRSHVAPHDVLLLAERETGPCAIVRLALEHGTMMLRGMQVDPAYHRQGIGTQLLVEAMRVLNDRECYCIPFAHLVAFYGRVGFAEVSPRDAPSFLGERVRRYRAEGHDVVIMYRAGVLPHDHPI